MDKEKCYIATEGTSVPVRPLLALPDGNVDLNQFRQSAHASAVQAAETSYSRLFDTLDQSFHEQEVLPQWAHDNLSAPVWRRIESILIQARKHRQTTAKNNAEALINCLASPETAGAFQSLLPSVLGFPPLSYANGYTSLMERENSWVLRLLASLPPARLVPAVSGGLNGHLFDPFRPFFHEPSLIAFLNGPFGDLRHFEESAPLNHNRVDLGISFKDVIGGSKDTLKALHTLRRQLAKMKKENPPSEPIVSKALGVELNAGELEQFGMMGSLIERAARETRPIQRSAPHGAFLAYYLRYGGSKSGLTRLPDHVLGPYLAERFDIIDLAFGLDDETGVDHGYQPHFAAELLRHLPKTPNRYKDALYRMALGEKRSGRTDAQRLLGDAQGLLPRLEKSLNARGKDERLQAALCLGRSGDKAALPLLKARIAMEKNVEVKNTCLAALKTLGFDIKGFGLDRVALIEEAKAGLGKPLHKKRVFLADLDLPDLAFDDGTLAPLELAPWLVRYAADMGLPSRNELLNLRLSHLQKSSRVALARAVLDGWVRHDTLMWKETSFKTHRALFLPGMYKTYLCIHDLGIHWHRHRYMPGKPPKTPAQHAANISPAEVKEFLREKTTWGGYVNSSYDAKGALALCSALPVGDTRKTLSHYLKHHSARGPQIKALMTVLAGYPGKTPITVLTKIADAQKQKSLKQHAIDLLADLSHPYAPANEEQSQASYTG